MRIEMMWKDFVMAKMRLYPDIYLEELRKNTKRP